MSSVRKVFRDPRRWFRGAVGSAFAEFSITTLYALSSILIGILLIGVQATSSWYDALSVNARQGEVMIASLAMMGPLAYSVVAEPPIKYRSAFQLVVLFYTLVGVSVYVANKLTSIIDGEMMVYMSSGALVIALVLNLITTISNHHVKGPADTMRDSTLTKARQYAEHAAGRN